jgi:hypothetical protein
MLMEAEILVELVKAGGIAALAVGGFFIIYKALISANVVPKLRQWQGFVFLCLIAILTFAVAAIALLKSESSPPKRTATGCVAQMIGYNTLTPTDLERDCLNNKVVAFTWSNDIPGDANWGSFMVRNQTGYQTIKGNFDPKAWIENYIPAQEPNARPVSFYRNFGWEIQSDYEAADFHVGTCDTGPGKRAEPPPVFEKRIGFLLKSSEPRPGNHSLTRTERDACNSVDFRTAGYEKCGWIRLELFVPSSQPKHFCEDRYHSPGALSVMEKNEIQGGIPLCVRPVNLNGEVSTTKGPLDFSSLQWGRIGTIRTAWCD